MPYYLYYFGRFEQELGHFGTLRRQAIVFVTYLLILGKIQIPRAHFFLVLGGQAMFFVISFYSQVACSKSYGLNKRKP